MKPINIGYGNCVAAARVVNIVRPESVPIKRMITEAREAGQLVDATYGRKTKTVMVMNSGHVVLSSIHPDTMAQRVKK